MFPLQNLARKELINVEWKLYFCWLTGVMKHNIALIIQSLVVPDGRSGSTYIISRDYSSLLESKGSKLLLPYIDHHGTGPHLVNDNSRWLKLDKTYHNVWLNNRSKLGQKWRRVSDIFTNIPFICGLLLVGTSFLRCILYYEKLMLNSYISKTFLFFITHPLSMRTTMPGTNVDVNLFAL